MPGAIRPRRMRTVIDAEAHPLLLLLATLVSLLTAGVLAHALRTARSRDILLGWGWVLAESRTCGRRGAHTARKERVNASAGFSNLVPRIIAAMMNGL